MWGSAMQCFMAFASLTAPAEVSADSTGERRTVTVMGRQTQLYMPKSLREGEPRAAIFVLHGSGGVAADIYNTYFESQADTRNFFVAYPEMKVPRSDEWGYKDDIPFFSALVDRLQSSEFSLDPARVYICGHSAGGTMSLFLQNEVELFSAAGAVEAAVGHLHDWDMSKPGHRTMVVWNHADPVLEQFAPPGGEPAYHNLTVSTLRRHGSMKPIASQPLPTSRKVVSASLVTYASDSAPELVMLNWRSDPGTHRWPNKPDCSFDAAEELLKFFMGDDVVV
eukprot:TRINITY_DN84551_c0_g1_i1.p1 TRINITY_DN84551_c0_g1~~TRINITY_DN84551_c0_g1_i1.p1  ORF type:complete len:293 (+),score=46.37 TRINITY_DN84551_c0_g1_i1:42-881(+)